MSHEPLAKTWDAWTAMNSRGSPVLQNLIAPNVPGDHIRSGLLQCCGKAARHLSCLVDCWNYIHCLHPFLSTINLITYHLICTAPMCTFVSRATSLYTRINHICIHLHTSGYSCTIYTFKKQSFIAALRNKSLKWSPTWGGRSHCRQGTRSCRSLAKACPCKQIPMPSMLHVSINSQHQLSFAEKPVGGWWRWVAKIVSACGQILVHVSWHGHHELNSSWFLGTSLCPEFLHCTFSWLWVWAQVSSPFDIEEKQARSWEKMMQYVKHSSAVLLN